MDPNSLQTSFIPKKPIVSATSAVKVAPESMSLFLFLSIVLLVISLLASGGLYVYRGMLVGKVTMLQSSLAATKGDFEKDTISELQFFDTRMSASKQVLAMHRVLSPFFSLLGTLTVPSVQFTKFSGEIADDGKTLTVKMSGLAKEYKSIAQQAQVFNSNRGKYFKDVVFSNLLLSEEKEYKGYVGFDIAFSVDPVLISYEKNILNTTPVSGAKLP